MNNRFMNFMVKAHQAVDRLAVFFWMFVCCATFAQFICIYFYPYVHLPVWAVPLGGVSFVVILFVPCCMVGWLITKCHTYRDVRKYYPVYAFAAFLGCVFLATILTAFLLMVVDYFVRYSVVFGLAPADRHSVTSHILNFIYPPFAWSVVGLYLMMPVLGISILVLKIWDRLRHKAWPVKRPLYVAEYKTAFRHLFHPVWMGGGMVVAAMVAYIGMTNMLLPLKMQTQQAYAVRLIKSLEMEAVAKMLLKQDMDIKPLSGGALTKAFIARRGFIEFVFPIDGEQSRSYFLRHEINYFTVGRLSPIGRYDVGTPSYDCWRKFLETGKKSGFYFGRDEVLRQRNGYYGEAMQVFVRGETPSGEVGIILTRGGSMPSADQCYPMTELKQ